MGLKITSWLGQMKVYVGRANFYVTIINFVLLLATFKVAYDIEMSIFLLAPICGSVLLLIGFVDYKLLFFSEMEHINKQNDIKHQLDKIELLISEKRLGKKEK